jgi:hypothetical protein
LHANETRPQIEDQVIALVIEWMRNTNAVLDRRSD